MPNTGNIDTKMIRTLQTKLNTHKENEKQLQDERDRLQSELKHHKHVQISNWDKLQEANTKFCSLKADREALQKSFEAKCTNEESLLQRIAQAETIAQEASHEALRLTEEVNLYYAPERQKLIDAEEEIKRLKASLRRTQNDLKIAKMPEARTGQGMIFTRQGSQNSVIEDQRSCKGSPSSGPVEFLRSTKSASSSSSLMEIAPHQQQQQPCNSAKCICRNTVEVEARLKRARQQETQFRQLSADWQQKEKELGESLANERLESKKLTHRMTALRERNKQLQKEIEKQKLEFGGIVNELKSNLRQRKQESRTIFEMWKSSLEGTSQNITPSARRMLHQFEDEADDPIDETMNINDVPQLPPSPTPYDRLSTDVPFSDELKSPPSPSRELSPPVSPCPDDNALPGPRSGNCHPQQGSVHDLGPKVKKENEKENSKNGLHSPIESARMDIVETSLESDLQGQPTDFLKQYLIDSRYRDDEILTGAESSTSAGTTTPSHTTPTTPNEIITRMPSGQEEKSILLKELFARASAKKETNDDKDLLFEPTSWNEEKKAECEEPGRESEGDMLDCTYDSLDDDDIMLSDEYNDPDLTDQINTQVLEDLKKHLDNENYHCENSNLDVDWFDDDDDEKEIFAAPLSPIIESPNRSRPLREGSGFFEKRINNREQTQIFSGMEDSGSAARENCDITQGSVQGNFSSLAESRGLILGDPIDFTALLEEQDKVLEAAYANERE